MKYYTHNQLDINPSGTYLQGTVEVDFDYLCEVLGKPMTSGYDDLKSDAEWRIRFDDGQVATIYNWKNGRNYCGDEGLDLWEMTNWNVGGLTPDVVPRIKRLLKEDITGQQTALPLP